MDATTATAHAGRLGTAPDADRRPLPNSAIVMLEDLGHDPREVLPAPVRGRLSVA